MKSLHLKNDKGFTLVEMMIAAGIMAVIAFGGVKAFQYFNNQTVKEAKKMDDISEFTALTKDLISFTEGAGISTFYLNLPVKVQGCAEGEPCVKQLDGETFKTPTALPSNLTSNTCIQFYKDAKGPLESKLAYPGKPYVDKLWENKEIELTSSQDLFSTWTLKDASSPPFMLIKSRDAALFLKQLRGPMVQTSKTKEANHQGLRHSFFSSDVPAETITKLVNYPFLIYSPVYPNQYNIQQAEEVVSCAQDRAKCINFFKIIVPNYFGIQMNKWNNDTEVGNALGLQPGEFPGKAYAIKFKAIDFSQPFFKEVLDRQNLPANCKSQWGDGQQEAEGYFFPSKTLSVSTDPSDTTSELTFPLNTLYISKYAASRDINVGTAWVAVPIDIVTFRAEASADPSIFQLVTQLWHPTEIKKKIKIHKLGGPFVISRKLGSQEMGIWYNPMKKN